MKRLISFLLILNFFFLSFSFAQRVKPPEYISQGTFAILLVRAMGMEGQFSESAMPQDYINLLEKFGIAPLGGFKAENVLTQGELATTLVRALGWEVEIFSKMSQCNRNLLSIMSAWTSQHEEDNHWMELEELLSDSRFFPDRLPVCPWIVRYADVDKNHIVDSHIHNNAQTYIDLLVERNFIGSVLPEDPVTVVEVEEFFEKTFEAAAFVPVDKVKETYIVPASSLQE